MLKEDGTISFADEILDALSAFLAEYESSRGVAMGDLERGLVLSYLLGVMRCEVEAIWDALGEREIFAALHPRAVFDECRKGNGQAAETRRSAAVKALARNKWFGEVPTDPDQTA